MFNTVDRILMLGKIWAEKEGLDVVGELYVIESILMQGSEMDASSEILIDSDSDYMTHVIVYDDVNDLMFYAIERDLGNGETEVQFFK